MTTSTLAHAFTANQVTFEFLQNGRYRVNVFYTVPALKEFRSSYVDFTKKREAETFYFSMVKGADFYYPDPKKLKFNNEPLKPMVW